jgi:hypothetical protein
MQEVLILADENPACGPSVLEDFAVAGAGHPDVESVARIAAFASNPARQFGGQLIVHQEFHEAFRIGWSDCRAAYSIAA